MPSTGSMHQCYANSHSKARASHIANELVSKKDRTVLKSLQNGVSGETPFALRSDATAVVQSHQKTEGFRWVLRRGKEDLEGFRETACGVPREKVFGKEQSRLQPLIETKAVAKTLLRNSMELSSTEYIPFNTARPPALVGRRAGESSGRSTPHPPAHNLQHHRDCGRGESSLFEHSGKD